MGFGSYGSTDTGMVCVQQKSHHMCRLCYIVCCTRTQYLSNAHVHSKLPCFGMQPVLYQTYQYGIPVWHTGMGHTGMYMVVTVVRYVCNKKIDTCAGCV